jgi:hypothetical protein
LVQHWLLQIFSISSTVDNWGSRQSFSSSCWWGHLFSAKSSQEFRHWHSTEISPVDKKNQNVPLIGNSIKKPNHSAIWCQFCEESKPWLGGK